MGKISSVLKSLLGISESTTQQNALDHDVKTWAYSSFGSDVYVLDTVRASIDAIARNTSKMEFRHIVTSSEGKKKINTTSQYARVLRSPNSYMTMRDFIYKCTSMYYARNNCFIFPEYEHGKLIALHPINYQSYRVIEQNGNIFIRFVIKYTREYVVPFENVICLRRFYCSKDFTGDNNEALIPSAELINAQNQGIINSIKNSAVIRGILKTVTVIKEEDLQKKKKQFVADNLSMQNSGGVIAIDGKYDYIPLESKPYVIDDGSLNAAKSKIFDYFGVNQEFVQNDFTADKYDAVYEGCLEPFAVMFSQALTKGLFTSNERGYGNEIEIAMNRLKYQPISSVINLMSVTNQTGTFSRNEYREMLGYGPIDDGDEYLISLNYDKASNVLKKKEEGKENDD